MSPLYQDESDYDQYWQDRRRRESEESSRRLRSIDGLDELDRHANLESLPWQSGFLWGPAGVGKTRTACAMLASSPGIFLPARELVQLARAVELDRATDPESQRFEMAFEHAYLALDDLGTRKPSDFAYDAIYALIDHRAKHQTPTIVTSNIGLDAIANLYDDRIASRLASLGTVTHLTGKDWRLNP